MKFVLDGCLLWVTFEITRIVRFWQVIHFFFYLVPNSYWNFIKFCILSGCDEIIFILLPTFVLCLHSYTSVIFTCYQQVILCIETSIWVLKFIPCRNKYVLNNKPNVHKLQHPYFRWDGKICGTMKGWTGKEDGM